MRSKGDNAAWEGGVSLLRRAPPAGAHSCSPRNVAAPVAHAPKADRPDALRRHPKKDLAKIEAFRTELCEKLHDERIALETSVHRSVSDGRVPRKSIHFMQEASLRVAGSDKCTLACRQSRAGSGRGAAWKRCCPWSHASRGTAPTARWKSAGTAPDFAHRRGDSGGESVLFGASRAECIVIQDGAGFRQDDGAVELPANVRVISLPPYRNSTPWNGCGRSPKTGSATKCEKTSMH